ncbi:hypothetical protein AAFC00_006610 [Neodothiora populina]|uniref:Thioesterase/thiol ester dehydrase-isomerase n=1 Tax=Neodothiora populina TaxID=2781224 RepID=A0ABR3PAT2_9PEZI
MPPPPRPRHLPLPIAGSVTNTPRLPPITTAQRRQKSTSSTDPEPPAAALSPRWLSDLKSRVGKCITFGLSSSQVGVAGKVMGEIARDWRDLVAEREGFLTGPQRRGLYRHTVVWGEMDSMREVGHVNNVTYNRYAESARVEWARKYATYIDPAHRVEWGQLCTNKGDGLIMKSIKTDFKFPMTCPDHITVYHKLAQEPEAGSSSFVLDVLILSELHQRPAARLSEDLVLYDYTQGKKAPLRPFMLDAFKQTWRLQEEARKASSEKVKQLLHTVRQLELDSWDRADAKEDFGSAAASGQ